MMYYQLLILMTPYKFLTVNSIPCLPTFRQEVVNYANNLVNDQYYSEDAIKSIVDDPLSPWMIWLKDNYYAQQSRIPNNLIFRFNLDSLKFKRKLP